MDDSTQKEIGDYLSGLPKSILEVIQDTTWPKRVLDIAIKYSLTDEQTIILKNLILFVIIGIELPETFTDSVEKEMNISKILTEQLIKDVNDRVFQYIYKLISEKNEDSDINGLVNTFTKPEISKEKVLEIRPNISLETKPKILPVVEKGENLRINPIAPVNLPSTEIEKPNNIYKSPWPQNSTITHDSKEFVQKPLATPKYDILSENKKLNNNLQQESSEDTKEQPKTDASQLFKKYPSDPYREPIE